MIKTFKRDWKGVAVQAVINTVVLLALVIVISYGLGAPQREAQVSRDVQSVRVLICKSLGQAENPDIVEVIREQCGDLAP